MANLGESTMPVRPTFACRECLAEVGELHALNCRLESCPRHDEEFASCECDTPWDYLDACDLTRILRTGGTSLVMFASANLNSLNGKFIEHY